ncbi:hypothetical protein ASPTUDRAFT_857691 [Aspergillus tubingensis CBS 134.48]|uniref:Uncharacterized protein n=1 Tax=Aspergillus tubingensis (strain CBS 134.48) TaxID=767770 RepID=A0A1L9MTP8_ASPTC|nr:hypothetical protein ASPTUDRAFT_857691 [Aspergillus tubingensis CBS 134.48]
MYVKRLEMTKSFRTQVFQAVVISFGNVCNVAFLVTAEMRIYLYSPSPSLIEIVLHSTVLT